VRLHRGIGPALALLAIMGAATALAEPRAVVFSPSYEAPELWTFTSEPTRSGGWQYGHTALGRPPVLQADAVRVESPEPGKVVGSNGAAPAWLLAIEPTARLSGGTQSGDVLFLATATPGMTNRPTFWRVARTTGAVAWQRTLDLPFTPTQVWANADVALYGDANGEFVALGAADGAEKWRQSTGATAADVAEGRLVLRIAGEGLRVLDLQTGETRQRLPLPDVSAEGTLALDQTAVYAIERTPAGSGRLRALDVQTGRLLWESAPGLSLRSPLTTIHDVVFALGEGGDLRALETRSGELRWALGLGDAGNPGLWRRDDELIVSVGWPETLPANTPFPLERARVSGRVTVDGRPWRGAPIELQVGDRTVRTGPDGRFEVRIEGRVFFGVFARRVNVSSARPPTPARAFGQDMRPTWVRFEGRGKYTVQHDIETQPGADGE
jgi:outer membrane protein assembly factor BamB